MQNSTLIFREKAATLTKRLARSNRQILQTANCGNWTISCFIVGKLYVLWLCFQNEFTLRRSEFNKIENAYLSA